MEITIKPAYQELEAIQELLSEYAAMVEEIRKELKFTTLKYQRLDDMMAATGVSPCKLCTYCWTGKE